MPERFFGQPPQVDKTCSLGLPIPMEALKAWRLSRKLSQGKFAELVGLEQYAISRYERGRVPSPEIMQKIIDVTLGQVRADDWFIYKPEWKRQQAA